MEINIKEFSEKLGTDPKRFRRFLRSGKLSTAKKVEGTWQFDTSQILSDPFEYIKNLMSFRTGIKIPRIKKQEEEVKVLKIPEYITDGKSHWYGIKVDGGREMEVKECIDLLRVEDLVETFVPTQTVIKSNVQRTQNILTKIVFIKSPNIMNIIAPIKDCNSKVKGFWMSMPLDKSNNKVPALIDDETVISLKELHGRVITDEEIHGFEVNKMVEVISGPFKHTKGFIQAINGDIIHIEIEMLGRIMPMHIASSQLRIIVE